MKISDRLVGAIFVAFGIWMFIAAAEFPAAPGMTFGAGLFPRILAAGFVTCGLVLIVQQVLSTQAAPWYHRPEWAGDMAGVLRFVMVPLGILFYIFLAPRLGMIFAAALILAVIFRVLKVRLTVGLPVALLAPVVIYLLFSKFLLVPLPRGLLDGVLF